MSRGYLVVRVAGAAYGLPVSRVLEVGDLGDVLDIPRSLPAVRGLTPLRGHLVPLIHLGALLGGEPAPAALGRSAVVVELHAGGTRQIALEVDDVDEVIREDPLPVPRGEDLPWASGVARPDGGGGALIPVLDLDALEDRIG